MSKMKSKKSKKLIKLSVLLVHENKKKNKKSSYFSLEKPSQQINFAIHSLNKFNFKVSLAFAPKVCLSDRNFSVY